MKEVTLNSINSRFLGSAVIDRVRDTKSSLLLEQMRINREFKTPLSPALLYNYYVSICLIRSYDLTNDKVVGMQLGYPSKAIGNVRRRLQKGGWIHFDKFTHRGKSYGQWFLGKEVVAAYYDREDKVSLKEQVELGVITEEEYMVGNTLEENMYGK